MAAFSDLINEFENRFHREIKTRMPRFLRRSTASWPRFLRVEALKSCLPIRMLHSRRSQPTRTRCWSRTPPAVKRWELTDDADTLQVLRRYCAADVLTMPAIVAYVLQARQISVPATMHDVPWELLETV
jgi:hypothetical protein